MTKPKYVKPPIQEAICEVHFDLPSPMEADKIFSMEHVWKSEYPDQKRVKENGLNVQLNMENISVKQDVLGERLICRSSDPINIVQLNGRLLAVNRQAPYPHWEKFKPTVLARWADMKMTLGLERFRRVGLRYINKIDIPQSPLRWEDWFTSKLPTPGLGGLGLGTAQMNFVNTIADDQRIVTNIVCFPQGSALTSVVLDFDVIWEGTSTDDLSGILEKAHDPLWAAFKSYLTEKVEKIFQ